LQVKLKFTDFTQTTLERAGTELDLNRYLDLLPQAWERGDGQGIRLLGLGVSMLDDDKEVDENQMTLF
nr:hypothetical protein [Pseudomonadales bacterium]